MNQRRVVVSVAAMAATAMALAGAPHNAQASGGVGTRSGTSTTGGDYPQWKRIQSLRELTASQRMLNAKFNPAEYGDFQQYFPSPDFGDHVALLPTGKVLLFSFERIETDPTKEPAPTDVTGSRNAGRAWLWDPAKGYGRNAFKDVPPPVVNMPDGLNEPRPAPVFCAGQAYLPNGMVGIFGGNLGGKGGSGAKLALVFDPWNEHWYVNKDMHSGRWYPTVVTDAQGRQLIFSGQSEHGWGTPTPLVEQFPASSDRLPVDETDAPQGEATSVLKEKAPFSNDYPQAFSLNNGQVYALGRDWNEQWRFDPVRGTRTDLANRPDGVLRYYGSAVALPNGYNGPDSILVLGGDQANPNTYKLSEDGNWTTEQPRAFGRQNDDTLILPDSQLITLNGSYGIRDYGNGNLNPKADLKYRQIELQDQSGKWHLGPSERLPRGYHSNAVLLPDGRIMLTGDELQQLANDPDINDGMNGTIEIYSPAYLFNGPRPKLNSVSPNQVGFDDQFTVTTTTPDRVAGAVLVAPITSTHSIDTGQRQLTLRMVSRSGNKITFQAPPSADAAPPGYYMVFLLNSRGVPSVAKWVKLNPLAGME